MADNSILQELTKIEASLKSINSAKQQVDAVIAADNTISKNIKTYSNSLNELVFAIDKLKTVLRQEFAGITSDMEVDFETRISRINKLIDALNAKIADIITSFQKACAKTNADFIEVTSKASKGLLTETHNCIDNFSNTTKSSVSKLQKLESSINASASELCSASTQLVNSKAEMLSNFDSVILTLTNISKKIDNISKKQDEVVRSLIQHFDNKSSEIIHKAEEIYGKIASLSSDINTLSQNVANSNNEIKSEISSLKKHNLVLFIIVIILAFASLVTNFIV